MLTAGPVSRPCFLAVQVAATGAPGRAETPPAGELGLVPILGPMWFLVVVLLHHNPRRGTHCRREGARPCRSSKSCLRTPCIGCLSPAATEALALVVTRDSTRPVRPPATRLPRLPPIALRSRPGNAESLFSPPLNLGENGTFFTPLQPPRTLLPCSGQADFQCPLPALPFLPALPVGTVAALA